MRTSKGAVRAAAFLTALTALIATGLLLAAGAETTAESAVTVPPAVVQWGMMAAALAAGASALGAAYAVAHVGSAAVGALAEKPELLGRLLIMVGLAEGIAIYGLIVAILILNRIG
ncbi:MAG: ATP synthase subunit C [Gammaproteobacteria bacterium]|nr:ATP synthase subunit C [Gammaproteobacteria bacterium]MDH4313220.1 ATP synthase subunit C [Gammaproteobacteria bacterium]MDH5213574.1 ATP synthase subunit C [Gammaproteobacteria bacterium]MDH5501502.1 ATP synthase subunit C [Gammaproteobacteria bacterium]